MSSLQHKANALLALHEEFVVLPNVWDAWSARAVEDAGFAAMSIGSHPLADSRGQSDGEDMSIDDAMDSIARITAAVDVPVTADLESGYGLSPAELMERLLDAGAVGLNVEDTVHSEGRVRSSEEHAEYIAGLRQASDDAGVDVVINARTDAFVHPENFEGDPVRNAVERMVAAEKAGARVLYPVGAPGADALRAILNAVTLPVNVIASPREGSVLGPMGETKKFGIKRVTFGPRLQRELTPELQGLLSDWK